MPEMGIQQKVDTKEGNRGACGIELVSTGAGAADQSDDKRTKTQWDTLTLDKGHWQFTGAL